MEGYDFSFTPVPVPGAMNPPLKDQLCYGVDLRTEPSDEYVRARGFDLSYIVDAYTNLKEHAGMDDAFFTAYFDKLVGVDYVRPMIQEGVPIEEIEALWQEDLEAFKKAKRALLAVSSLMVCYKNETCSENVFFRCLFLCAVFSSCFKRTT